MPGFGTVPSLEPPAPAWPWLCELSAAAILPAGEAEDPGAEAGNGTVCCAEAITASCRMSRLAARKTTYWVNPFISALAPLL